VSWDLPDMKVNIREVQLSKTMQILQRSVLLNDKLELSHVMRLPRMESRRCLTRPSGLDLCNIANAHCFMIDMQRQASYRLHDTFEVAVCAGYGSVPASRKLGMRHNQQSGAASLLNGLLGSRRS
jgi:hypothetical protein